MQKEFRHHTADSHKNLGKVIRQPNGNRRLLPRLTHSSLYIYGTGIEYTTIYCLYPLCYWAAFASFEHQLLEMDRWSVSNATCDVSSLTPEA